MRAHGGTFKEQPRGEPTQWNKMVKVRGCQHGQIRGRGLETIRQLKPARKGTEGNSCSRKDRGHLEICLSFLITEIDDVRS